MAEDPFAERELKKILYNVSVKKQQIYVK